MLLHPPPDVQSPTVASGRAAIKTSFVGQSKAENSRSRARCQALSDTRRSRQKNQEVDRLLRDRSPEALSELELLRKILALRDVLPHCNPGFAKTYLLDLLAEGTLPPQAVTWLFRELNLVEA